MRRLALVSTVLAALAAPALAQDAVPLAPSVPHIVTRGEGMVTRAPDLSFVTLAVESRARSSRDAQRMNAEAMSAVHKRLLAAGIAADALRTIGLSLHQQFDDVNGRRVPRDFVARNTLEVRISDVSRTGELADLAVQEGATSLSNIRFDLKDRSGAEREALRLAVADARARADAMAAGAGRVVDRILKIDDSRAVVVPPTPMFSLARADAAAVTPTEPGLIEIRAQVTLTVSMK
jgi:uncharacterized protein YggE